MVLFELMKKQNCAECWFLYCVSGCWVLCRGGGSFPGLLLSGNLRSQIRFFFGGEKDKMILLLLQSVCGGDCQ